MSGKGNCYDNARTERLFHTLKGEAIHGDGFRTRDETRQAVLEYFERLFQGTVDGASVYPRVVVSRRLELNAAAVIFTHNHPSCVCEPSEAEGVLLPQRSWSRPNTL